MSERVNEYASTRGFYLEDRKGNTLGWGGDEAFHTFYHSTAEAVRDALNLDHGKDWRVVNA